MRCAVFFVIGAYAYLHILLPVLLIAKISLNSYDAFHFTDLLWQSLEANGYFCVLIKYHPCYLDIEFGKYIKTTKLLRSTCADKHAACHAQ